MSNNFLPFFTQKLADNCNKAMSGLRVKKTIVSSDKTPRQELIKEYFYTLPSHPNRSSGIKNFFHHLNTVHVISEIEFYQGGDSDDDETRRELYLTAMYPRNIPLFCESPISYSAVTVKEPDNGKSVHYFTNFSTHPDQKVTKYRMADKTKSGYQNLPIMQDITRVWQRGLPTHTYTYTNAGKLKQHTQYEYTFNAYKINESLGVAFYLEPGSSSFNSTYGIYKLESKFFYLKKKTETVYNQDASNFAQTQTEYIYKDYKDLQVDQAITTDSEGRKSKIVYRRPRDYDIPREAPFQFGFPFILRMRVSNIISPIIESQQFSIENGVEKLVGAKLNLYKNFATSGLRQAEIFELNLEQPITNFRASYIDNNGNLIKDSRYKPAVEFVKYNSIGGLLEAKPTEGHPYSYIWGYDNKHIIAKVENATYQDLTNVLGSATLSTLNTNTPDAVTLGRTLQTLRTQLPNAIVKTYTYDTWRGLTSKTGANAYTSYYEYDCLDRLKRSKDHNQDIVAQHSYFDYGVNIEAKSCQAKNAHFKATYNLRCQGDEVPTFTWNFGDGNAGSGSQVNHIYTNTGNFSVTLTALFSNNFTVTKTLNVQIQDSDNAITVKPIIREVCSGWNGEDCSDQTIGYELVYNENTSSCVHIYPGATYGWEKQMPDGSWQTMTNAHRFQINEACLSKVRLKINNLVVAEKTIRPLNYVATIRAAACQTRNASFTVSSHVSNCPTIWNSSFHWDFGDGNSTTTTAYTVNHTYASDGNYTVTLTVTYVNGFTKVVRRNIVINSGAITRVNISSTQTQIISELIVELSATVIGSSCNNPTYNWQVSSDGSTWRAGTKVYTILCEETAYFRLEVGGVTSDRIGPIKNTYSCADPK